MTLKKILVVFFGFLLSVSVWAGTEGSISGSLTDPQGIAIPNTKVQVLSPSGTVIMEATTSTTGDFQIFPLNFGDYGLKVQAPEFAPYEASVHVSSGATTQLEIHLEAKGTSKEMVMEVKAKRHLINNSSSTSSKETTHEDIETLPQGSNISLPKLLEVTNPGVVQGPFNQTFIRGNHANVQYQIDGVQLPDSTSGTFAEAFSTRNIDHMEFITGGLPAEYGERDAAVVNIITKTGPETPNGSVELNYGSYNTFNPQLVYGGSDSSGGLHYFISSSYITTNRGVDTPQPSGTALNQQTQGGTDAIHDQSNGNSQFLKLDWLPNNQDKVSFIAFQNYNFYQIPNFPSSFSPSDPYFSADPANPYTDAVGNTTTVNTPNTPIFNYSPSNTNDTQTNQDAYAEIVWKHTFSEHSFLQIAPYWKYSKVRFDGDPTNDLASATTAQFFVPNSTPSTFSIDRHVNNVGLKTDYTTRPNDQHLIKTGFQLQGSQASDSFGISGATAAAGPAFAAPTVVSQQGGGIDRGLFEDVYAQDDWTISKQWTANFGLRYTAFQFNFPEDHSSDFQVQPRIGVSFLPDELTKLHVYYGRLFMPAPLEDLREAFNVLAPTPVNFYDIKAEKDNYFEFGVDRQVAPQQVVSVNTYYKVATNMLDDTQLLNTAIATPYNYQNGYAYGVEFSVKGKLNENFSDFFNYSYEVAKGETISGGTFAVNPASIPANTYLWLDHVQVSTANAGLNYSTDRYFATVDGLYGSGLRTGPLNTLSLPQHFTFDLTGGYKFRGDTWLSNWKVQGDILNIFNNVYPITIANGFNGSHYAAGREFFVRLTKEL